MDTSLYLSKEYNLSSFVFEQDLHWLKLFVASDKRRKKLEERLRQEAEQRMKNK